MIFSSKELANEANALRENWTDPIFTIKHDQAWLLKNALHHVSPEKAARVENVYSPALERDLNHNTTFWKAYEGRVQKASDAVNNTYLKSNQQSQGVKSYGLMVDWLVAYKRRM